MIRHLLCWLGFHKFELQPTLLKTFYDKAEELNLPVSSTGVFGKYRTVCKYCGKRKI